VKVPLVEARGVEYAYGSGDTPAIAGVDLAVAPGELCVLLGPNGSGKSTLLKLLGGLRGPRAGSVMLEGRPLTGFSPRERARRIAVVPQLLSAVLEIRVEDFVAAGRYAHLGILKSLRPADRAAVARALLEADAQDLCGRLCSELSGGQRQRVLIARALAQEAELLLFDEPSAALDPDHQVRLFALIAELVGRGRAAIVATHELVLASRFATRAVLLQRGRTVASGTPAVVLCREVLEPLYGPHLWYGQGPRGRPVVVPWLAEEPQDA
jgi:iron complex transport system ATP-binding protein